MKVIGYRVSAGRTQKECAEIIKKNVVTYASKEKGETPFTVDEAYMLAKFLDCPIEAFVRSV